MAKKAFDKIAEGLSEALAIARGEARPAMLYIWTRTGGRGKGQPRTKPMKSGERGSG
jgi:hypothetical protein